MCRVIRFGDVDVAVVVEYDQGSATEVGGGGPIGLVAAVVKAVDHERVRLCMTVMFGYVAGPDDPELLQSNAPRVKKTICIT